MKGLGNLEVPQLLRQTIALKPDYATHENLGSVLIELRELDEAIATLNALCARAQSRSGFG